MASLKIRILTILKLFGEPKVLRFLLSQRHIGYLYEQGWFNSFISMSSVDKNNQPIPWMTYPFIDFIKERLNKELKIFEFGSGNSTLYFANKVKVVFAVEHNRKWYDILKNKMPENVSIFFKELNEDYENSVREKNKFDIICVDGERRVECILYSIDCLSESGVLVLDDSERIDYTEGINFLLESGFKRINFWGVAPGTFFNKCTTIFYKRENCLNI